jgi:hypothetical protein
VQPLCPDHAEQSAENFTFVRLYEERDRIPLIVPPSAPARRIQRRGYALGINNFFGAFLYPPMMAVSGHYVSPAVR